jgi:hypothetical protein
MLQYFRTSPSSTALPCRLLLQDVSHRSGAITPRRIASTATASTTLMTPLPNRPALSAASVSRRMAPSPSRPCGRAGCLPTAHGRRRPPGHPNSSLPLESHLGFGAAYVPPTTVGRYGHLVAEHRLRVAGCNPSQSTAVTVKWYPFIIRHSLFLMTSLRAVPDGVRQRKQRTVIRKSNGQSRANTTRGLCVDGRCQKVAVWSVSGKHSKCSKYGELNAPLCVAWPPLPPTSLPPPSSGALFESRQPWVCCAQQVMVPAGRSGRAPSPRPPRP